jgi:hypothetical protein
MSAVAAARAVQTPTPIDVTDAENATIARPLTRFPIWNAFARVLSNLFSAWETNGSETALAVDW